jgi:nucleoside-diphosphate-sugar epimerase
VAGALGVAALVAVRRQQKERRAQSPQVVVLGLGYCGSAIAQYFSGNAGYSVLGSSRGKIEITNTRAGVRTVVVNGDDDSLEARCLVSAVRGAKVIIATAPPAGEIGDPFLSSAVLKGAIEEAAKNGALVIYLSSVGVYGDQGGRAVTEETPAAPRTARAKRRLAAEESWRQLAVKNLVIMRLPGIYGATRGPLAKPREGNNLIVKEGHMFSRIHVDDVVTTCAALEKHTREGNSSFFHNGEPFLLNCCDSEPAPQHEVSRLAYVLLGRPVPNAVPFEKAELSEMQRSFYAESRFMDNSKLLKLVPQLKYPSYRTGLPACLQEEQRLALASSFSIDSISRWTSGAAAAMSVSVRGAIQSAFSRSSIERVALIDNGSLKPEATFSLRRLSEALEKKALAKGRRLRVDPVAARFADRIPAHKLGGRSAEILPTWIKRVASESSRGQKVIMLPLLIGPAGTLTEKMPDAARTEPDLDVDIAPPLVCICPVLVERSSNGASQVATMLEEHLAKKDGDFTHIFVCDHGSPMARVAAARQAVVEALQEKLKRDVTACCMERRDGPEYDFNGPLLEDALAALPTGARCGVALLFLQEGRHAGPGGDIVQIIDGVLEKRPDLSITTTSVLGEHPALIDLLFERLDKAVPLRLWP